MKKQLFNFLYSLGILLFCISTQSLFATEDHTKLPFTHGVNMTRWFELWEPGQGNLNYYDEHDIEHVTSLGADIIRLPIHFENLSSGYPDYKINELTWKYLDEVVDCCEKLHLYLVIDNHSFNTGKYPSAETLDKHLQKVWPQIASRYKNRSKYILYEILNEPHSLNATTWNKIQGKALATIRKYDTKHTVVVSGTDWSDVESLNDVQVYNDNNLIYTFHFYLPFIFTHQGANWGSKELVPLSHIPFPYDSARMPPIPNRIKGTYMENELKINYPNDGTISAIENKLQIAANFSKTNNVPVWCGEMGAYYVASLHEDRVRWYKTIGSLLKKYNIPYTVWGYGGGFGLFKKDSKEQYPNDLDSEIVTALNFSIPQNAESDIQNTPSNQLVIFDDIPARNVELSVSEKPSKKPTLLSSSDNPSEGLYCIRWGNVKQFEGLNFTFIHAADLSSLLSTHAVLRFNIRSTIVRPNFDVRFVDKETTHLKPWRMSYTVDKKDFITDGKWHTIDIPLSKMKDRGAWSSAENKWYDSENKFDWHCIDMLQFSSESGAINDAIFIDDIKIISEEDAE